MPQYKAILFDVDGTLVDSVDLHARAWVEVLEEYGHSVEFTKVRHDIGKGGDELMKDFLSEDEIEAKGEEIETRRGEIFKEKYLKTVCGFPQVRSLFEKLLADGKKIVLASSAKGSELGFYKKAAQIEDLIEDETSKDDVEKSKPHPDIFQAALDKLKGIEPHEALVVGDTPWDIIAAKKAGLASIGVLCGGFPEVELLEAGASSVFKDPADLLLRYAEGLGK